MPSQDFASEPVDPPKEEALEWFPANVASSQDQFGIAGGGSITPMTRPGLASPGDEQTPQGEASRAAWRAMTGVVAPPVTLDYSIAFERTIGQMVETARSKRADYALSDDEFSNFRGPADLAGIPAWLMGLLEVQWKLERIKSLRANGRTENPQNESVEDTIKDVAVFGVLAYAMWLEEKAAASG